LTERITENPFLILGLSPDTPRMSIEREAQKLLGMLELGLASAAVYATPLGPRPRTAELVRAAVATLRDPARRLAAEIWTRGAVPDTAHPRAVPDTAHPRAVPDTAHPRAVPDAAQGAGVPDALARMGWRSK